MAVSVTGHWNLLFETAGDLRVMPFIIKIKRKGKTMKKTMGKWMSLLLAGVVCISLTACGGGNDGTDKDGGKASTEADSSKQGEETVAETEDSNIINFEDVVLVDNDDVKIELVSFYAEDVNWTEGKQNEKCITLKVTNKTDYDINFSSEFYLDGERTYTIFHGGSNDVAAGKSGNCTFCIAKDTQPEHTALESLDELYNLEGTFEVWFGGKRESLEADFSIQDTLGNEGTTEEGEDNQTSSTVKTTEHMDIKGICVDNSYKDEKGRKQVYLFYDFIATDKNLKIDSVYTKMTIGGANTYESEHMASSAAALEYMPNYYYSTYIEEIFLESSQLVAATFYVPEADLAKGKTITISDDQIPGCEEISFMTDDIQYFDNPEDIAKEFDAEGYKEIQNSFKEADEKQTKLVKSLINGYYWSCFVNSTTYEVEFWEDNNFEVRTSIGVANQGTYSVRNGYIFCTYSSNDKTIKIPYEIKDGEIDVDIVDAFDVKG